MKNLKKLVSVIVTLAMLISSFAAVSVSAAYADVDETNSYYKAIEVLSGLGVVKGDDEGNFNPTSDIKRSEMVALICRAKGEEAIAQAAGGASFADVAADHWAAGYIAWGVASDIIKGVGDNKFDPDASVKFQDAVVMVLRALGYERIAQRAENGGYPTGYLKVAGQKGVLANASAFDGGKAATREIVAQVIYNAMTTPLVDVSYYAPKPEDDEYVIFDGSRGTELRTLLTYTNEIYKVKAEVTATAKEDKTLRTDNGAQVVLTVKDAYDYNTDSVCDILDANASDEVKLYAGETTVGDYLGYTVEAYIVEDEDLDDWKVLAAVVDTKSVEEETVVAADVDFVSFTSNTFKYLDANDKEQEIAVNGTHKLYYNGREIVSGDLATALSTISTLAGDTISTEADLLVKVADSITFMGPRNEDYNKIFVTDYSYMKAVEVMADELYIKAENTIGDTAIELDTEARNDEAFVYNIYDAEGNAMDIADIAENDILNIVAPLKADESYDLGTIDYMDIYVSNETVEGRVDEEVVSGKTYSIAGQTYDVLTTVKTGDEGVFYLTIDGRVYACDAASITKNYGFIVAHDVDPSFGTTTHTLRVFKADGTFENFTMAPIVALYLDVPYTVADDPDTETVEGEVNFTSTADYRYERYTAKRSDKSQDKVADYLDGFLADYNATDASATDAEAREWVENAFAARIMTYTTNDAGEIKEMRFASSLPSTEFSIYAGGKYYADTAVFAGQDLSDDSVLFVAPITKTVGTGTDLGDDLYNIDQDKLEIASFKSMKDGDTYDALVVSFDRDEYLGAAVMTNPISSDIQFAHLAVVQSRSSVLDADQNTVDKYTFVQSGETIALTMDSDYAYASDLQIPGDEVLEPGDIIRYTVNAEGNIDSIEHIYDADGTNATTGVFADCGYSYASLDTNEIAIVYGEITEIKNGNMKIAGLDKLKFNATEGNTYASIDEERVNGAVSPQTGVKAIAGTGNLKASYGSKHYSVVAIVGENNRFEDCVMIIEK